MKRLIAVSIFLLVSFSLVRADFRIRMKEHRDGHYHHGSMEPAEDSEGEIWFGENMVAMIQDDRRYIMDAESGMMIIIEMTDSVYVETPMPLDLAAVVPEDQVPRLAMFPTVGEVEKLDETKEVRGRECSGYRIKSWVMYKGNRYNERESRIWSTTEIPVDPELLKMFNRNMISLRNMSEEMAAGLNQIEGINFLAETVEYSEGFRINSSAEVVECMETEPVREIYSVPDGFRKQERLSPRRR
jgi:hypothetical protein